MNASTITDFDAAQALLDLHSSVVVDGAAPMYQQECDKGLEQTARLLMSCFVAADLPAQSHLKLGTGKTMKDAATQTEDPAQPTFVFLEENIKHLCEKIRVLEAELNNHNSSKGDVPQSYRQRQAQLPPVIAQQNNIFQKPGEMVPIGEGHASVPVRVLKHINWNSHTMATRKLLETVFPRRVLATHSLTGKPSPAFPNKPAKKKLDPALVCDIVQTVVERCAVPESVVRTSITTKLADESKMYKTRKLKRTNKQRRENIPPSAADSDPE